MANFEETKKTIMKPLNDSMICHKDQDNDPQVFPEKVKRKKKISLFSPAAITDGIAIVSQYLGITRNQL